MVLPTGLRCESNGQLCSRPAWDAVERNDPNPDQSKGRVFIVSGKGLEAAP
jgi:hypothetical protein